VELPYLVDLLEGATCYLCIMPCVTFLLGQITPKNSKNDYHMSSSGVSTCHDKIIMTYYADINVEFDLLTLTLTFLHV
jgi:hypothetical protein